MIRQACLTSAHPDDPRPWAEVDLEDGKLAVTVYELNGGDHWVRRNHPDRAHTHVPGRMKAAKKRHVLKLDKNHKDETHVLVVNLDGDLEFVAISQQAAYYYAHLGWYEPSTGEWTKIVFVDENDNASIRSAIMDGALPPQAAGYRI